MKKDKLGEMILMVAATRPVQLPFVHSGVLLFLLTSPNLTTKSVKYVSVVKFAHMS